MSLQDRVDDTQSDAESLQKGLPHAVLPGLERRTSLSHALLATVREPVAILDRGFRVLSASRSFAEMFPVATVALPARPFCEPGSPRWSEVALQTLRDVLNLDLIAQDVEIEVDTAERGSRRMLLNARQLSDRHNPDDAIVISMNDVTDAPEIERLRKEVALQQATLLSEAHHRIANSLQIIASILLLKARAVKSEEVRMHLRDVHKRLILVAAVQRQLCNSGMLEEIEFGPYVAQLCHGLTDSMTENDNRVSIVTSSTGRTIKSDDAISFGLIVTELVLNALKHGFPDGRHGCIEVDFAATGADWRLSVSDDGVGRPANDEPHQSGLGTNIVEALARHLKATVEIGSHGTGTSTTIAHIERAA